MEIVLRSCYEEPTSVHKLGGVKRAQDNCASTKTDPSQSSMPDFNETKRLLDAINAVISGYDQTLKEHATSVLLKSVFGWQPDRRDDGTKNRSELAVQASELSREARPRTLKDYAEILLPRSGNDRAMLSLYYLNKVLGFKSATGYQIRKELKANGMDVANISVAMQENVRFLRAQSRVIRGDADTRQARNEFTITDFGIQYVETRFSLDYIDSR